MLTLETRALIYTGQLLCVIAHLLVDGHEGHVLVQHLFEHLHTHPHNIAYTHISPTLFYKPGLKSKLQINYLTWRRCFNQDVMNVYLVDQLACGVHALLVGRPFLSLHTLCHIPTNRANRVSISR